MRPAMSGKKKANNPTIKRTRSKFKRTRESNEQCFLDESFRVRDINYHSSWIMLLSDDDDDDDVEMKNKRRNK